MFDFGKFLENCEIVHAFGPADINSDATGDYVSLKGYDGCLILFFKNAGTAGDDPVINLTQASDVAGTGVKALNFTEIWAKVGTLSSVGQWTKYTFTATNNLDLVSVGGTDLAADSQAAMIAVDIQAADLDVNNGFDCLKLFIEGDDIGNAVYAAGLYILYRARYPQATPINAITD